MTSQEDGAIASAAEPPPPRRRPLFRHPSGSGQAATDSTLFSLSTATIGTNHGGGHHDGRRRGGFGRRKTKSLRQRLARLPGILRRAKKPPSEARLRKKCRRAADRGDWDAVRRLIADHDFSPPPPSPHSSPGAIPEGSVASKRKSWGEGSAAKKRGSWGSCKEGSSSDERRRPSYGSRSKGEGHRRSFQGPSAAAAAVINAAALGELEEESDTPGHHGGGPDRGGLPTDAEGNLLHDLLRRSAPLDVVVALLAALRHRIEGCTRGTDAGGRTPLHLAADHVAGGEEEGALAPVEALVLGSSNDSHSRRFRPRCSASMTAPSRGEVHSRHEQGGPHAAAPGRRPCGGGEAASAAELDAREEETLALVVALVGADPGAASLGDGDGRSPLHLAVRRLAAAAPAGRARRARRALPAVTALKDAMLARPGPVDFKDEDAAGHSPLDYALAGGLDAEEDLLEALLRRRAPRRSRSSLRGEGWTDSLRTLPGGTLRGSFHSAASSVTEGPQDMLVLRRLERDEIEARRRRLERRGAGRRSARKESAFRRKSTMETAHESGGPPSPGEAPPAPSSVTPPDTPPATAEEVYHQHLQDFMDDFMDDHFAGDGLELLRADAADGFDICADPDCGAVPLSPWGAGRPRCARHEEGPRDPLLSTISCSGNDDDSVVSDVSVPSAVR